MQPTVIADRLDVFIVQVNRIHRPGWREGEELQSQRGAIHDFTPAAGVRTLGQPASPIGDGLAKQVFRLWHARMAAWPILRAEAAQDERNLLPFAQREVGVD